MECITHQQLWIDFQNQSLQTRVPEGHPGVSSLPTPGIIQCLPGELQHCPVSPFCVGFMQLLFHSRVSLRLTLFMSPSQVLLISSDYPENILELAVCNINKTHF